METTIKKSIYKDKTTNEELILSKGKSITKSALLIASAIGLLLINTWIGILAIIYASIQIINNNKTNIKTEKIQFQISRGLLKKKINLKYSDIEKIQIVKIENTDDGIIIIKTKESEIIEIGILKEISKMETHIQNNEKLPSLENNILLLGASDRDEKKYLEKRENLFICSNCGVLTDGHLSGKHAKMKSCVACNSRALKPIDTPAGKNTMEKYDMTEADFIYTLKHNAHKKLIEIKKKKYTSNSLEITIFCILFIISVFIIK